MRYLIVLTALFVALPARAEEQESQACTHAQFDFFSKSGVGTPTEIISYLFGTNPSCAQANAYGAWLRQQQTYGEAVLRLCSNMVIEEDDTRGVKQTIRTQDQLRDFYDAQFVDFSIDQKRYCSGNFVRISAERVSDCGKIDMYYRDGGSDSKTDVSALIEGCNLANKSTCLSTRIGIHQIPAEVPTALDCGATQQELVYPTEDARRTESDAMAACDFLQNTEVRPLPEDKIRQCNSYPNMCEIVAESYRHKGTPIPGLTCTETDKSK